ncbi:unnamed protein product [Nippostrongylus brasiliensis]|uniref:Uncharacterized protein n=1 Tax=Nippostrongylus brasiliensis TaxID=27835 RepID=A0A3P7B3C8_NIPBR|nr:unnamed protein product [Nippostrongylus brasiliensis]
MRIVEDDAFIAVSAKYKDIDTDEEKEDIEIISSITKQVEARAREAPKFRNSFQPIDEVKQEPPSPEQERGEMVGAGRASRLRLPKVECVVMIPMPMSLLQERAGTVTIQIVMFLLQERAGTVMIPMPIIPLQEGAGLVMIPMPIFPLQGRAGTDMIPMTTGLLLERNMSTALVRTVLPRQEKYKVRDVSVNSDWFFSEFGLVFMWFKLTEFNHANESALPSLIPS